MVAPRLLLEVARVVAIYTMIRWIVFTFFYLAGLYKIRKTEKQAYTSAYRELSGGEEARQKTVHHLVVLPNFREPLDILRRTLQSLSVQVDATDCITVVLGMEARELEAKAKVETLRAEYKDKFFCLLTTFHPANLPGEAPGKAMNETWATHRARQELVERLGISPGMILVTVVDSDSVIHPRYFAELARQFTTAPHRYSLIWQAPLFSDNEIWHTSPMIRLLTFFTNAITTGDYFNPFEAKFPYSNYSLSLKLLEDVNYWDPTMIDEDINIFMRAFILKGGEVFVKHIYLPVHSNPVYGANLWHAIGIFYNQKVRQGWGGTEIGYMFQKWNNLPGTPLFYKIGRFLKLFHDHLFFSTAGFIVSLGTVLSILIDHTAVITLPPASFSPLFFIILNFLGGSALVVVWFAERIRLSRGWTDWNLKTLAGEIVSWFVFPIMFFLLMNLPGLQAQTMMLLGRPLQYVRTPKGINSKIGE